MKLTLTQTKVDRLITAGTQTDIIYYDTRTPQLGLRLRPQGGASWVIRFSERGREQRHRFGRPGPLAAGEVTNSDVLDLNGARARALDLLQGIENGINPNEQRRAMQRRQLFEDVWQLYLASPAVAGFSVLTRDSKRNHGRKYFLPLFGRRALADLDAAAGRELKRHVAQPRRKGKRQHGGTGAASKSFRELSAFLSWAASEGYIKSNPVKGVVSAGSDSRREIEPLTPEQYGALFAAIDKLQAGTVVLSSANDDHKQEAIEKIPTAAADAIRVLALTGCRRNEIRDLTWSQVDVQGRRLVFAPRQHKAGKRTGRPRVVELAPAAVAVIERQQRLEPMDRVFAGRGGKRVEINRCFRGVARVSGLPRHITPHALRHSLGGIAAMNSMSVPEIMRLLGHSTPSQAMRYVTWAQQNTGIADRVIDAALGMPKP